MARVTSTKTKEQRIEDVFEAVASGLSVSAACKDCEIGRATFYREILADSELWDRYARARSACAEVHFDEIADLEAEARGGELDPQTFRVLLDSKKWRLGKMNIHYSDKQIIEQKTTLAGAVEISHSLAPELQSVLDSVYGAKPEESAK